MANSGGKVKSPDQIKAEQKAIEKLIEARGEITRNDIVAHFNIPINQIKARLASLKEKGKIKNEGKNRSVYWSIGSAVKKARSHARKAPDIVNPDFAGLPSEVRHFAGYR